MRRTHVSVRPPHSRPPGPLPQGRRTDLFRVHEALDRLQDPALVDTEVVTLETADVLEIAVHGHAGGWAAVVTGLSPIKAMSDGKVYAVRWTAFYVRTEQSWQLAASQATRSHEIKP